MKTLARNLFFSLVLGGLFYLAHFYLNRFDLVTLYPLWGKKILWPFSLFFSWAFLLSWFFIWIEGHLSSSMKLGWGIDLFECLFSIALIFSPFSHLKWPYFVFWLLAMLLSLRLIFTYAKWDWFFFLLGSLLGTSLEAWMISWGKMEFLDPARLGIPLWIPLIWGGISLSARRWFKKRG